MTMISLNQIRRTAAEILAAAVLDCCPDALLIEGSQTSFGFAYDFVFLSPFSDEMLPHIERRMKTLIKEDLPVTHHEMVPSNATTWLRHQKRHFPSLLAKEQKETLVDVLQIKDHIALCPGPFPSSTSEIGPIALLKSERRSPIYYKGQEKCVTRLYGVQADNPQTLKQIKKEWKETHLERGVKKELFLLDQSRSKRAIRESITFTLLPKGSQLKQTTRTSLLSLFEDHGFLHVETQGDDLLKEHARCRNHRVAEMRDLFCETSFNSFEGMLSEIKNRFYIAHLFCTKENFAEAFQNARELSQKIFKTLGLNGRVEEVKSDHETSFYIEGRFGEMRKCITLEVKKEDVITLAIMGTIERLMALMIEAGNLSFQNCMKDIAKKNHTVVK